MLYLMLAAALTFSGLVMAGLTIAFAAAASEPYRIRPEEGRRLKNSTLYALILGNSLLSITFLFGSAHLFYAQLFYEGQLAIWRLGLETVGILMVYDLIYYLNHRFLLHGPIRFFYKVHVLHHTAQHPQAKDSLYVHPVETLIGLVLLMLATWAVGPVHIVSFGVTFTIYSIMNIVIHGGLQVSFFPLRFLSAMARKHDRHHTSMKAGNYASITPVFDRLFGTAE